MNPGGGGNDLYNQIGPGFAAFVVVFLLALAIWLLVRSMNGHLRRVRYREAAEQQAQRERNERSENSGSRELSEFSELDELNEPREQDGRRPQTGSGRQE
ncbi:MULTISPECIES: hypothetical protein [Arsenicicoccus]|uniref:hypothetical protein n=1 Tax=Arsenicicoccus TaxID=267408 RepID=UPI00257DC145|nr:MULTISPECIES: hypothetical protein [Arsenicicoccus]